MNQSDGRKKSVVKSTNPAKASKSIVKSGLDASQEGASQAPNREKPIENVKGQLVSQLMVGSAQSAGGKRGQLRPRWAGHLFLGFEPKSHVLECMKNATSQAPTPASTPAQNRAVSTGRGISDTSDGPAASEGVKGRCVVLLGVEAFEGWAKSHLSPWMAERTRAKRSELHFWALEQGPLWVGYLTEPTLPAKKVKPELLPLNGNVDGSPYVLGRELGSQLAAGTADFPGLELAVEWVVDGPQDEFKDELLTGFFAGLELGTYKFKSLFQGPRVAPINLKFICSAPAVKPPEDKKQAVAVAVNLARHLVNLPPNLLNPVSYSELIANLFADQTTTQVEIWKEERLERERCHLIRSVGGASQFPPALVHIRYRPKNHQEGEPVVFVAKGITFDSGGLDIKDSGSMRLMKKDMGGSASALAIAWWAAKAELPVACDFYLALAENAVGSRAFRPGDVVMSRAGISIEIDNTDAEGRLVLADAIDVALENNPRPQVLINLSTLTGAMRVALGTKIAGYFTNQDSLVPRINQSAVKRGEPVWQMPLFNEYRAHLKSSFADLANSGPQRFGGAISAAMFLERFAGRVPWLHVDHYSWIDGPSGGCLEPGGNGQLVQLFADFLSHCEPAK